MVVSIEQRLYAKLICHRLNRIASEDFKKVAPGVLDIMSARNANNPFCLFMISIGFPSLLDSYLDRSDITNETKTEALRQFVENKRGRQEEIYPIIKKFFKAGAQNPYNPENGDIVNKCILDIAFSGFPVPIPKDPKVATVYRADLAKFTQNKMNCVQRASLEYL